MKLKTFIIISFVYICGKKSRTSERAEPTDPNEMYEQTEIIFSTIITPTITSPVLYSREPDEGLNESKISKKSKTFSFYNLT